MAGSTKSNSLYLFLFYFLFSSLIIFADSRGISADFRGFVQGFTIPVESQLFRARIALFAPFSVFSSGSEKDKRIQELEEENAGLLSKLSQMKALEEENAKARYLLGASLPPSWHFEPARVVSVFADKMFLISDARAQAGPLRQSLSEASPLRIGRIEETIGKRAAVTLPTNERMKITVRVRDKETGERHGSGIVAGRGGRLALEQVLTSEMIEEEDLIVTSGDENLPPELLVGYVTRVHDAKGAFREAEVKPAVDPAKLDFVFLITKW